MIIPFILFSIFLGLAALWIKKTISPDRAVQRKYQRKTDLGPVQSRLREACSDGIYGLFCLFCAEYTYFPYLWITFSVLSLIASIVLFYTSPRQILHPQPTAAQTDESMRREVKELRWNVGSGFVLRGILLISWLKTFPVVAFHPTVLQEQIVSVITVLFAFGWSATGTIRLNRQASKTSDARDRIKDGPPKRNILVEILPWAYDFKGKPTPPPDAQHRLFRPTEPMSRYVSGSLSNSFESIDELNRFLGTCKYVPDIEQFGRPDWWLPPEEFERMKKGDCEDYSLYAWRQLSNMGYSARFVVGRTREGGHAWVNLEKDGKQYLVEPLSFSIPILNMMEYRPEISVEWDGNSFKYFSHNAMLLPPTFGEMLSFAKEFRDWVAASEIGKGVKQIHWWANPVLIFHALVFLQFFFVKRGSFQPFRLVKNTVFLLWMPIPIILILVSLLKDIPRSFICNLAEMRELVTSFKKRRKSVKDDFRKNRDKQENSE